MVWQTHSVSPGPRPMIHARHYWNHRHSPSPPATSDEHARSHRGSLRSKLVLSLAAIFLVFLTIDEMVRQQVIEPEFTSLEKAGATRDANRVLAAMNAEVEHLRDLTVHLASQIREQTLTGPTAEVVKADSPSRGWSTQKLDWAATVGPDGSWTWLHRAAQNTPSDVQAVDHHFRSLVHVCRDSPNDISSGMTRSALKPFAFFETTWAPIRSIPGSFEASMNLPFVEVIKV